MSIVAVGSVVLGLAPRRVVLRHAVRNALIPVVTVVALQVPTLFTGAIITETVFAWPGMGRLFYDGVQKGDYPRLMALLVISSLLIVLFNLIAGTMAVGASVTLAWGRRWTRSR